MCVADNKNRYVEANKNLRALREGYEHRSRNGVIRLMEAPSSTPMIGSTKPDERTHTRSITSVEKDQRRRIGIEIPNNPSSYSTSGGLENNKYRSTISSLLRRGVVNLGPLRLGKLPPELQLEVAQAMGPDATIEDWLSMEMVCKSWLMGTPTTLSAWLEAQSNGVEFARTRGTPTVAPFLMAHVSSKRKMDIATCAELICIVALAKHGVSVFCHVDQEKDAEWWLEKQRTGDSEIAAGPRIAPQMDAEQHVSQMVFLMSWRDQAGTKHKSIRVHLNVLAIEVVASRLMRIAIEVLKSAGWMDGLVSMMLLLVCSMGGLRSGRSCTCILTGQQLLQCNACSQKRSTRTDWFSLGES